MASQVEEPQFSQELTFITSIHCPYAQRTWIALNAKGVKYSTLIIDLRNKPSWFFKYNPLGRVPTLVYKDEEGTHSLYESLICNEFINELPGVSLLPAHPAKRAHARIIIDRFNTTIASAFAGVLFSKDVEAQQSKADQLVKELSWFEEHIDETGPYFLGSTFTLVDAALMPWFLRLAILGKLKGFSLPSDLAKLNSWSSFLKENPAVTGSFGKANPELSYEDDLEAVYINYFQSRS